MKRHILFIDSLEKLVIKKDSSLMMALSLKEKGHQVFLLFEEDFCLITKGNLKLKVFPFSGAFKSNSFYLDSFDLGKKEEIQIGEDDCIHMRIDPPFDTRYLRYLWMLRNVETFGAKVFNSPLGILAFNEKLTAFEHENSLRSFIGIGNHQFLDFIEDLKKEGVKAVILKPLELYQGIGVEKVDLELCSNEELSNKFQEKVKNYGGAVIAQAFVEEIYDGEIRTIFFKGKELGTILKVPPKGEYLANIAQGASFKVSTLNDIQRKSCLEICERLGDFGVDFIAFDILGNKVSEVNITCPGLMVEVSEAMGKNLFDEMIPYY